MQGYEIVTNTDSVNLTSNNDYRGSLSVSAPSGKKVIGGGGAVGSSGTVVLVASNPGLGGSVWSVTVEEIVPQENTVQVSVYAVCATV